MKTITILKKLITIYYYLMFIALGLGAITSMIYLFTRNSSFEIDFLGNSIDLQSVSTVSFIAVICLIGSLYLLFFMAVYYIRETLNDLSEGKYFTSLVISNFNKIGKLFILCGIGSVLVKFILGLILNFSLRVGIDSALVLFIITGLFFMFLSEVFAKGKHLKEENDLTI